MGQEKIKSQKVLVQKSLDANNCEWTSFGFRKFLLQKKFGSKLFWILCAKKFVGPKKMWSRNILIKRNHGLQKLCPSNSWNIHDMGKFCQDQCFLDKCDDDSWNRGSPELPLKFGQNLVSNSWDITYMDKCRQDKCCMEKMWLWQLASLKEGPRNLRNLPWKFGQYRASNSWDITNKDKCCEDRCCLDKCHCDS